MTGPQVAYHPNTVHLRRYDWKTRDTVFVRLFVGDCLDSVWLRAWCVFFSINKSTRLDGQKRKKKHIELAYFY